MFFSLKFRQIKLIKKVSDTREKCDPFELIISVGTFKIRSDSYHLLFHHNIGQSQTEYIKDEKLDKVLEIAGWEFTNKFSTLDHIFMNLKSYKKWTVHGYGRTKFYVGLDLGKDLPTNIYKDYVRVGQEQGSITVSS